MHWGGAGRVSPVNGASPSQTIDENPPPQKFPANPRLTLRNACTTITTKHHRRSASAPAPRSIAASRVSAPFRKDIDNRIMKPRSAGGTTQDRGRGRFQTRPCPNGPRRCPPEVEDRLGRNADRQPGHCGIVAQVLGCGRMTPAPTSKPDGHPRDAGATLVVACAQGFDCSRSERIP